MKDTDLRPISAVSENTCGVSFAPREISDGRLWKTRKRGLLASELTSEIIARFKQKYTSGEGGCWLWKSTIVRGGYGQFYLFTESGQRVRTYAHRVAYVLANGDISGDMEVMHRCDVPGCVNPDHLTLGTHRDNMRDRMAKGRAAKVKPSLRVISPEDVIAIRRNDRPAREWARKCGVCVSHINRIRRGEKRKVA